MGVAEDSSKHVHVFVAKSYTGSIHSVCKLNQWVLKDFCAPCVHAVELLLC